MNHRLQGRIHQKPEAQIDHFHISFICKTAEHHSSLTKLGKPIKMKHQEHLPSLFTSQSHQSLNGVKQLVKCPPESLCLQMIGLLFFKSDCGCFIQSPSTSNANWV
uniref:Uncharacterized protein n=2 Tax=Opuntia streptacantha TaxID=393608 RepID=A0A7C8YQK3_OPUST